MQKKEECSHYQRMSQMNSKVPRSGPFLLGTEDVWVQGETAGERAHDFISSNLTELLQRVWEVICAYHCCQPEQRLMLMACDKWNIFPAVSILVYHQKCPPSLQKTRYFDDSNERSIFLPTIIPDFKYFSLHIGVKLKLLEGFHKESMLSLALTVQVQHVVHPGLKKGHKAKLFSKCIISTRLSWGGFYSLLWELLHIYAIYYINTWTFYCSQGLDPSRVHELDCCDLGLHLLVHFHLF